MSKIAELAQQCDGAHRDGQGWRARCPVHGGKTETSLYLTGEDDNYRIHCFAGCKVSDILAALGEPRQWKRQDFFDAIYTYQDAARNPVFEVTRKAGKQFRQRRPHPTEPGKYINNMEGVPYILYHLPEVQQAITLGKTIYIAEGEKDVETLRSHGLVATCNRGGAGKWDDAYTAELTGATVVLLADNDQPGKNHVGLVSARLNGAVRKLTILSFPDLPEHGDISDWFFLGHTAEELEALSEKTAPTLIAPHLVMTGKFGDVETEEVSWLWEPYIPLKKITILEGDPGQGKTFLMLAIAAAVTNGHALPDQRGRVGAPHLATHTVLYMSGEDDLADTLKPRAERVGANCERLFSIDGWSTGGATEPFSFAQLSLLSDAIRDTQAKLVIIDPIQAFIGAQVDIHRTNEVRPLMTQLMRIAALHRCAILVIRHLNKGSGKALYRGQGSVDFTASARSVLVVAESLEDETKKVMAHEKASLQAKGASQVFQINGEGFFWCGTSKISADDLVSQQPNKSNMQRLTACEWLEDSLRDGERLTEVLKEEAEANGISWRTLERAKVDCKVISFKKGIKWYWKLHNQGDTDYDSPDDNIDFSR